MVIKREPANDVVNGVYVMRIPSRDAYSYALRLLDVFFSKEELGKSLLFKSLKSDKEALDHRKVEQLLQCVEKRYGDKWDIKTLTAKINQKCRDSIVPGIADANSKSPRGKTGPGNKTGPGDKAVPGDKTGQGDNAAEFECEIPKVSEKPGDSTPSHKNKGNKAPKNAN